MEEEATNIFESQYDFGKVTDIKPMEGGLINLTFKVDTEDQSYIIQRLKILDQEKTVNSIFPFFKDQHFHTPLVLETKDGNLTTKQGEHSWRVLNFTKGQVFDHFISTDQVREVARVFAIYHSLLQDAEDIPSQTKPHTTSVFIESLQKLPEDPEVTKEDAELAKEVMDVINSFDIDLDKLFNTITHGDPKCSNFVFGQDDKVVSLLDNGWTTYAFWLFELGDALRSWCAEVEDHKENTFKKEHFQAAIQTYLEETKVEIPELDKTLLVEAPLYITSRLAGRFLVDVYEQKVFGWDKKRYATKADHDRARAYSQMQVVRSIMEQRAELKDILTNILK